MKMLFIMFLSEGPFTTPFICFKFGEVEDCLGDNFAEAKPSKTGDK